MIRCDKHVIQITHRPTGIRVFADNKSLHRAKLTALHLIRSLVRWGKQPKPVVIRKYDFAGPAGTFVRDLRTGQVVTGDDVQQILDRGLVEKFERPKLLP